MDEIDIQSEILKELKELNRSHSELVGILSLLAQGEIERRLSHIFSNSQEILAYQLTNGKNSSADIGKLVNVSRTTIANWWNRWEANHGIVETSGYRNPYRAKYSLIELALLFGKIQDSEEIEGEEGKE